MITSITMDWFKGKSAGNPGNHEVFASNHRGFHGNHNSLGSLGILWEALDRATAP
jgi:hypothetical protein